MHGGVFLLAMPPVSFWPAAFFVIVPLVLLASGAKTTFRALWVVLAVQLPLWLWLGRWLIPVTMVGYPIYAAYLSIYALLFVWIMRRVLSRPAYHGHAMAWIIAAVWVGMECLRGKVVFTGYAWFLLVHSAVQWPVLAQSADLLGSFFVSFLVALFSGLVVDWWRVRSGLLSPRRFKVHAGCIVVLLAGNVGYGYWRIGQSGSLEPGPTILVIQTNLPQDNKIGWTREEQVRDFQEFVSMTLEGVSLLAEKPDLVVWPETMLPGFGLEPEVISFLVQNGYYPENYFSAGIVALRDEIGSPMLVGSPVYLNLRVENEQYVWDNNYNAAYLIQGDAPFPRYDKVHLTPFGETMPYISAWPWLEEKLLIIGAGGMNFNLDSSEQINLLDLEWGDRKLSLATPICFEDTSAEVCRDMAWEGSRKRVDLFVNLSNDGWYGSYKGGRLQHLQCARLRCIENRIPMIRAANTGMSVGIDSMGNVVDQVGEGRYGISGEPGILLSSLSLDRRETLYARIGDIWAWACLGVMFFILGLTFRGIKQRKTS